MAINFIVASLTLYALMPQLSPDGSGSRQPLPYSSVSFLSDRQNNEQTNRQTNRASLFYKAPHFLGFISDLMLIMQITSFAIIVPATVSAVRLMGDVDHKTPRYSPPREKLPTVKFMLAVGAYSSMTSVSRSRRLRHPWLVCINFIVAPWPYALWRRK